MSCNPFGSESQACELGNYVSYAVNVSSSDDVIATLKFAQENNIRIVVRNTGHDLFGRSTGAGALAIWTHHLKNIEFLDWRDGNYNGPAAKVGAGVEAFEAVQAAGPRGLAVVTGECSTVGIAGGFAQGGGHSILSSNFGMGADQALEYEVVTAAGELVTASTTKNSDLYWALSGGGGGTYGIVISLTIRVHPAGDFGGATLSFVPAEDDTTAFREAVSQFHSLLPGMIDHGVSIIYFLSSASFFIQSLTAFNSTGDFVERTVLAPFTKVLGNLNIPFSATYTTLSYLDHFNTYEGPLPYGFFSVGGFQYGSRLIPRSLLEDDNTSLQKAITNLTTNGGVLIMGSAASYAAPSNGVPNAIFPPWRETLIQMQLLTPFNNTNREQNLRNQKIITNDLNPQLSNITPQSGAYMNEGDFNEPNWKSTFFGPNYDKLLSIKQKWDPKSIFYINKGVGSDTWIVAEDGRMCRADSSSPQTSWWRSGENHGEL
ncbi:fad linked oxidase, n-terminal [Trichoderma arundinaceum]|uniref:Fad linked oxidase, n-terminal n=1 Tax=Trichoderma arundinaceum TaxID=490622 RepID=A0A395NWS6_TRIAR|nr:fad linked oxidase, n-terminal [Trichoderma arundinaceum]